MQDLTYLTYAADELQYFITAYKAGFRYNAMVSQAQRICECYMKHLIQSKSLMNVSEIMRSHNLRAIYDEILSMGIDLRCVHSHILILNNYYGYTRYPGKDSFLATDEDVVACYEALIPVVTHITTLLV